MIQLNLLPDIKVAFIKAKRLKRMVMVVSVLAVGISVTLLVVMFSLTSLQKKHIGDIDKDIKKTDQDLRDTPDLAKILTIQNQLNSLPTLYDKRPVTTRVFDYIEQTTPKIIGITDMTVDFEATTFSIEGKTNTLESVNQYVDTLKFTNYTVKDTEGITKAFTDVVLKTFSRDSKDGAKFTITLKYNPDIFDSNKVVTLVVPSAVTTRSETELPSSGVFEKKTLN